MTSPLTTISQSLIDAVLAELADNPPKRVGVLHGDVAYDECCDGMLWARFTRFFLSSSLLAEDTVPTKCSVQIWAAEFEVGLLRCVPQMRTTGKQAVLPSPAQLATSAEELATDAMALMCGMRKAARTWQNKSYLIGSVQPDNTAGGCGGSKGTVTVEL